MERSLIPIAGLAAIVPGQAVAEVCDKIRPFWNPEWGPVGIFREFMTITLHPINVVFLAIVAMLYFVGFRITRAISGVMLLFLSLVQIYGRRDPVFDQGTAEGCIGSPVLAIAVFGLLGGWIIYRAARG